MNETFPYELLPNLDSHGDLWLSFYGSLKEETGWKLSACRTRIEHEVSQIWISIQVCNFSNRDNGSERVNVRLMLYGIGDATCGRISDDNGRIWKCITAIYRRDSTEKMDTPHLALKLSIREFPDPEEVTSWGAYNKSVRLRAKQEAEDQVRREQEAKKYIAKRKQIEAEKKENAKTRWWRRSYSS